MIYLGIDHSKKYSQYTIGDERGKILKKARISNEEEEIRNLMESLPGGAQGRSLRGLSCMGMAV